MSYYFRIRRIYFNPFLFISLSFTFLFLCYRLIRACTPLPKELSPIMVANEKYIFNLDKHKFYKYGRNMPLIFIGGVPGSGTTLLRAMLDAHPKMRSRNTGIIPVMLGFSLQWSLNKFKSCRLIEAGITKEVLDGATSAFILEIIAKHGEAAPRLCNKDPISLKMGSYIKELFPKAKFLFMVRDARATVTITNFNTSSYRECLVQWNHMVSSMYNQCKKIGSESCLMVPYEQLVLHPRDWMRQISEYLDLNWDESVLHHEKFINEQGGVVLRKLEPSSDQVVKPVNLNAMTTWVDKIPADVIQDLPKLAPMNSFLNYNPYANPPDYGQADLLVHENANRTKFQDQNEKKMSLDLKGPMDFLKWFLNQTKI